MMKPHPISVLYHAKFVLLLLSLLNFVAGMETTPSLAGVEMRNKMSSPNKQDLSREHSFLKGAERSVDESAHEIERWKLQEPPPVTVSAPSVNTPLPYTLSSFTQPSNSSISTCSSYPSCAECTSSSLCHWCAFDNQCHAIGSIYGCLNGVNCYSIERCQRIEPEKKVEYFNLPASVVVAMLFLCIGIMCCGTVGLCAASAAKGAYDDLYSLVARSLPTSSHYNGTMQEGYPLLRPNLYNATDPTTQVSSYSEVARSSNRVKYMYNGYKCCYFMTCIFFLIAVVSVILYYPRAPEYNICSDELEWKSVVDGMKSGEIKASFQMLLSVYNPNRFDIHLKKGSGTFSHDGAYVGHFETPPAVAKAESINDFLVNCTFTPNWLEAIAIASEYYDGTLTFVVNGYGFQTKFDEYLLVNGEMDRHLCACP